MAGDGRRQPIQPQQWLPDVPLNLDFSLQNLLAELKGRVEALHTDPNPPGPPTGITATGVAFGNLIAWNPVPKAAGYRIYRGIANNVNNATLLQELRGNDNVSWYDSFTTGTSSTKYYWVQGINASGAPGPFGTMVRVTAGMTLGPDVITGTNIQDDSIETPHLKANVVTAAKADLDDIFAQNITATGTITGLELIGSIITGGTIQTDESGVQRVVLDDSEGLLLLDASDVRLFQVPLGVSGVLVNQVFPSSNSIGAGVTIAGGDYEDGVAQSANISAFVHRHNFEYSRAGTVEFQAGDYINSGGGTGGVLVGSPTGGGQGTGTLNLAEGLYINGVEVIDDTGALVGGVDAAAITGLTAGRMVFTDGSGLLDTEADLTWTSNELEINDGAIRITAATSTSGMMNIQESGGATVFHIGGNPSAGETWLRVAVDGEAGTKRVSIGAADTGDAGFRVLQIPN